MHVRLLTILAVCGLLFGFVAPAAQAQDAEYYREVVFDPANVITADETGQVAVGLAPADLAAFQLACTEDSGTATLDVAVQRSINEGVSWANLTTFTQLSATGGQTVLYADVRAASAQLIGDRLRVNYDVTGTGQFTCTVYGAFEG